MPTRVYGNITINSTELFNADMTAINASLLPVATDSDYGTVTIGTASGNVPVLDANGKLSADVLPSGTLWTTEVETSGSAELIDHVKIAMVIGSRTTITINTSGFTGDAIVSFTTGDYAPTISGLNAVTMDGDHCANGMLTPRANTGYTIRFLYNGSRVVGFVSAYESLTPETVTGTSATINITAGKRYIATSVTNITITGTSFTSGQCQMVISGAGGMTSITNTAGATFTGVDCADGAFTPRTGKTYVVTFTVANSVITGTVEYQNVEEILPIVNITAPSGTVVTATNGTTTFTATSINRVASFALPTFGSWTFSGRLAEQSADQTVTISALDAKTYYATLTFAGIVLFGVRHYVNESSPQLTRLEDSANFNFTAEDGTTVGSSDFDDQEIFKDIKLCNVDLVDGAIVVTAYEGDAGFTRTPATGDVCVEFPKFYYKRDGSHLNDATPYEDLLISNKPIDGFDVDPAHADRGDGAGVRDKIYVGCYTADTNYRSISGVYSKVNITRPVARAGFQARGSQYHLWDIATVQTVWMLYKIAVSNLNSQGQIGDGFVWNSNIGQIITGITDSMSYHSGCDPDKSPIRRRNYATGLTVASGGYFTNANILYQATEDFTAGGLWSASNVEAFDATKTYAKGAFVSYDGAYYRCITAISTASEWDATKWTAVTEDNARATSCGYSDSASYTSGDMISKDGVLWRCLDSVTGTTPTEGECWTQSEPEFSTLGTYCKDDRVIYNGCLYVCTSNVTTAGEWNASKWSAISYSKTGTAGTSVKFLGMENLWGNIWQFVDGVNFDDTNLPNRRIYVATNPADYADNVATNYTLLSYDRAGSSGYLRKMGFDAARAWSALPMTVGSGANTASYYCDYYYCSASSDGRVAYVGGYWTNTDNTGLFSLGSSGGSTTANSIIGSRLLILP